DGAAVDSGDLLIVADNDQLVAERERLAARLDALEARARADFVSDKVALRLTRLEIGHVEKRIAELERKLDELLLKAGTTGRFALAVPEDLIGRFIRRGERLGFIIPDTAPTIRVAVGQNEVGLVHGDLQRVDVLSVVPGSEPVEAEVTRAVPQASAELPSMALATFGGGGIEVAADEKGNYRALKPLFHFELQLPTTAAGFHLGQKVHVKFVHGMEPVGVQTWRWLRQLFLSQLNV
ncbi:MAG TPA: hypothetical protein VHG33_00935, partial [Woeseiaceae bacterium]|nr:hypothetical protein [Woeseiaceae bacterium]